MKLSTVLIFLSRLPFLKMQQPPHKGSIATGNEHISPQRRTRRWSGRSANGIVHTGHIHDTDFINDN